MTDKLCYGDNLHILREHVAAPTIGEHTKVRMPDGTTEVGWATELTPVTTTPKKK